MIPEMRLGGLEARDVQAAIIPEGLDITLLGQSFLGQVKRVEISGDRMVLETAWTEGAPWKLWKD